MSGAACVLHAEIAAFRAWADTVPRVTRSAEWEIAYDAWPAITAALGAFLAATARLSVADTAAILYILARDNECETVKETLIAWPDHALALARAGVHGGEIDARWQLADVLGLVIADETLIAPLLETYLADPDEAVRRRARQASNRWAIRRGVMRP